MSGQPPTAAGSATSLPLLPAAFRRLLAAQWISHLGDDLFEVALMVYALRAGGHRPLVLGLLLGLGTLPPALLSLVAAGMIG
ncbi:MAG: hypothetical protein OWV35_10850, partial [Firmicutes bacterium]|nr:hypothetical protein [Bacillota bacterium]